VTGEAREAFACFGSTCAVVVASNGPRKPAAEAGRDAGRLRGGGVVARDDRSFEVLSAGRGRPARAAAPRSPGRSDLPCAA
jgi:hypothetical protein